MGESLFTLTEEWVTVADMLTDPETDPQVIEDTLENIMGAIEAKSEGYVAVLDRLDMELDACKKQEAAWKARRQIRENSIKRLKTALCNAMETMEKTEIPAGAVKIKLVKNGGQVPIIYDEGKEIPDRFKKIIYETDGGLVRKALEEGEELEFARFGERGKHVTIK
jgi:triacylglycerol esterase/lipase EstA (alpha/beta hydrolase family)